MLGILYGVGVGPGDPDLLTLKAVKTLEQVDIVFAASSTKNDYSVALEVVRTHLKPSTRVELLRFPMTFKAEHLEKAWQENSEMVRAYLEDGKDVAFITIGDPMVFSTFIYLMRTVRSQLPDVEIRIVPGITSFQAAAACAAVPLGEGEENITILSAAKGGARLCDVVPFSDNLVLMKTYRQFDKILSVVKDLGLEENCVFVSRCGLEDQVVEKDFSAMTNLDPHYLSLMIIKRNRSISD